MIDRIFQTVKAFINTDGRGNFSPTLFNLFLHNAIQEKVDSYLLEINQLVNRENKGLINGGLENVPDRFREKLLHYLKISPITQTSGLYNLPPDYKFFDTVTTAAEVELENCKNNQEFIIIKSTVANAEFPIYLKVGNVLKVAPAMTAPLTLYYIRKPLFPKWTYTVFNNAELFNPGANDFQDADIHPSDEDDITARVCLKFGINLKEPELQVAMQNKQIQDNNNQNGS